MRVVSVPPPTLHYALYLPPLHFKHKHLVVFCEGHRSENGSSLTKVYKTHDWGRLSRLSASFGVFFLTSLCEALSVSFFPSLSFSGLALNF